MRAAPLVVAGLVAVAGLPAPSQAQTEGGGAPSLDLGGYLLSLTGIHDTGYRLPDGDRRSGFHGAVARLEWRLGWGEDLVLEVHDRIQARVSSAEGGFGRSVAGFGVSAEPGRAVDLESVWIEDEARRLRVSHDVDRLALTAYTPVADVTVGRQAITWGTALLFPVADLWAQFSPFELDTREKPGVDAVRVLAYPAPGVELDAVVADRGARDDVSAGARITWSLPSVDLYGAAGRLWNEGMVLGGVTWILETVKLRAEGLLARDLDDDRWLDPRATVGVDRIAARWTLSAEYHFNGLGAPMPRQYLERIQSPSFVRGESYFLGRHYLGVLASWTPDAQERVRLGLTGLTNLGDPSGALLPSLAWDVGASTRLALGGLLGLGEEPTFPGPVPRLGSEYGTYGDLGYARISVFF